MTATQASQTTYCSGCDELKETVAKLQQQLCKMETISSDLVRGLTCLKSLIGKYDKKLSFVTIIKDLNYCTIVN